MIASVIRGWISGKSSGSLPCGSRAATLLICLIGASDGRATGDPDVVYRVRPSDDLRSVSVQARFPKHVAALEARDGQTSRLEALRGCNDEVVHLQRGRILTGSSNGCLSYVYPLEPQGGRRNPKVAPGIVMTTPSQWLWTPVVDGVEPVRIELSLPTAIRASVPWRQVGPGAFELLRSPGSATGSAVFGPIDVLDLHLAGARLRVAVVDGPTGRLDRQKMLDWLTVAARDVALVAGGFPNPDLQVIVQPAGDGRPGQDGRSRSPVPFGYVIRDGGEAVRFFVEPGRPLEDYLDDWTATHEFSHLLLPYVRSREKWVSEGFASYYQNVLLARRGAYSESEAWNRLHRSFERAAAIADPPRLDRLGERSFWEMRMLIYWSGAAFALLADAQLRELSGGAESLDTVLARLRECCLPSGTIWQAEDLFEKLDSLAPRPVFTALYAEMMSGRGMPDLTALYADLGIVLDGSRVRLTEQGRLTGVRKAIMGQSSDG